MNTATEIRTQIDHYLSHLSLERLKIAAEFLADLADKDREEATQELLAIPGFIESFDRGKQDIAKGRLADWRSLRNDV
jgi:hypothetical protein